MKRFELVQEFSPFEKLTALRDSLRAGRKPEPPVEVEFPASQGDLAFEYVHSLDPKPMRHR